MKRLVTLVTLSSVAAILLVLTFSSIDSYHPAPYIPEAKAACDLAEFGRLEAEFQTMVQLRKHDPTAISDEAYKAAASAYIENAEFCYETTIAPSLHTQTEPVIIDNGGEWDPHFELPPDEISGQYVVHGTKWGIPGLGNPGETVTYSYIPNGVSHAYESAGGNTHISNLNGFSSCFYTEIETAFAAWSAAADIDFVQVTDNGAPSGASGAIGDIRIGAHTFDGSSGILAHAYYPYGSSIGGDMHFDRDENWRCTPFGGFDIGMVTLHEIGHSLGLGHENINPAVMNPGYNPSISNLLTDDTNGVITIYGIKPPTANQSTVPFPILASTAYITYTLFLHNNSSISLTDVEITDTIPTSTTYVASSASNGGSSADGKTITWPPTTIAGNTAVSRSFKVMVAETIYDGDTLVNTLSLTSVQGASIQNQQFMNFVNPKLIYLPLIVR